MYKRTWTYYVASFLCGVPWTNWIGVSSGGWRVDAIEPHPSHRFPGLGCWMLEGDIKRYGHFSKESFKLQETFFHMFPEAREIYFCTITCYKWLNLIEEAQAYKSVYRWFEHLKKDGCLITGYVIMPNHFHVNPIRVTGLRDSDASSEDPLF